MKKLTALAAALVALMASTAFAGPASKFAAQVSSIALVDRTQTTDGWSKVLETTIKTPNQKDLLIGASFETGLYTQTKVSSKLGTSDTSNATATLTIKIEVDGVPAQPGVVTYDKRSQTLSATLGGIIESCQDLDLNGIIDVATECTVTDEEIELILDTLAAHHFNFVVANLTPGEHQVKAYAKIETSTASQSGSAEAKALVGKGSLTVEEVKATNAPDGIEFLQ